jgi:hypothetical protein
MAVEPGEAAKTPSYSNILPGLARRRSRAVRRGARTNRNEEQSMMRPIGGALVLSTLIFRPLLAAPYDNKLPDEVKAIFEKASQFELYSIAGANADPKQAGTPTGWTVLGKTVISVAEDRQRLLAALQQSFAKPGNGGGRCFNPRHALRAEFEGKSASIVICFECGWVYAYADGRPDVEQIGMDSESLLLTSKIESALDKLLRDAGVPLAKKAYE